MIKKILISQPKPASEKSPYFEMEKKYDVEMVFCPFIKVECITPREFRQQKVQILDHTAIVFNSRHAIDHFFNLCKELRVTIPENMKYFGASEKVVLYIQKYVQYRKRKVFYGETGKSDGLIEVMCKHKNEKFLIPTSDVHNKELETALTEKNLNYTSCVMYKTVSNTLPQPVSDFDMVILFTPSGLDSLLKNEPDFNQGDLKIGCFGKSTAKAIEDAGLRLDLEAPSAQAPSITKSLELYLEKNNV